jgi:NADP-dependent 3-hydroxy acid dehydrogenase YdfG
MPGAVNTPMMDGNTKFNRAKCIQVADIADTVLFVLRMATNACPTEVKVRPQYNAYNK